MTFRMLTVLLLCAGTAHAGERISPDNVHRLVHAWTYDVGDSMQPLVPGADAPAFEATPAWSDGRLYVSTPLGTVVALEAETGREVWRVSLRVRPNTNYSDFANRGPVAHGDRLYVGTVDARLVCLRRRDGRFCPGFGRDGQIDLTEGLRRKPKRHGEYGVTSPPAVYRDLVIVGSSVADNSRAEMPSGEVRAFDAYTGELRWTFHPLPRDAQAGGANAWSKIVVDESNALVFVPTGSASPDYFGGQRSGQDGYANSMVALDARTGEVRWHFQTVHHDLWDYDVASPAVLYPGREAPAVAVGSKTGHVFLLERLSGAPLFPVIERPVPGSDVGGEVAAATQPFPSRPESLVPHRIDEDDLWGPTESDLRACREEFRTLRNEGVFTPPSLTGSVHVPGNVGGLHWGGMVWDASERLLIAPVNRVPTIARLLPRARFDEARRSHPERETTEQDGTPWSMSRHFFLGPSGLPCIAPPWGELVAVSVDSGAIAWRVPLGDLRDHGLHTWPTPTGSLNLGGPVATETGVVFIGATLDPHLRAFETRSGRELWKGRLPTGGRATPLLFSTPKGREMIVIAAGGHGVLSSKPDTKLVAFALSP